MMAELLRFPVSCPVLLQQQLVGGNYSPYKLPMRKLGTFFCRSGQNRRGTAQKIRAENSGTGERDLLVAEFINYVESTQQAWPLEGRRPTHLMPPSTVVRVLMDALMRNDWPEDDSGIRTAFAFAMPPAANEMLISDVGQASRLARAWYATEKYLNIKEFADVVRDVTYLPLLDFVSWEIASPMTFCGPSDRRAVQAVRTVSQSGVASTFTFCLEKVINGVYKGCWMIVGVRVGDYANV